jgi:phosphatidylserine/phosphatidylglycerophosphate/cardiolipin synthase-like enzyme
MSNLSSIDQLQLEKIFDMEGGYVLGISENRRFKNLILENTEVDIYEDRYSCEGTSKANRLRVFWRLESNKIVGKLIQAMLEFWEAEKINKYQEISPQEKALFDKCIQISQKLLNKEEDSDNKEIEVNVHFEEIQGKIVEQIELANFTIWIAVAWFTDDLLFTKLVEKKNQGINVQLIIMDDDINNNSRLKYENIEVYKFKKTGKYGNNIMHNKFCVIDLKTVINGSYNWTIKAQYNQETINIITGRENAEKFAKHFIQLKNEVSSGF